MPKEIFCSFGVDVDAAAGWLGSYGAEDSGTPVATHAVQHVIHAPEHLPDWPNAERGSRIAFIAQKLEYDAVERSLQAFHRLARAGRPGEQRESVDELDQELVLRRSPGPVREAY